MENKRLIELVNVTKDYDGDIALENINLYIRDGEFLTLLGPSGCGKTTLLRLIAGFIMPSSGQIIMDGKDLTAIPPYKRRVNTVFQKHALFPHMNVFENIAFGLKIHKISKDVIEQKVMKMLKLNAVMLNPMTSSYTLSQKWHDIVQSARSSIKYIKQRIMIMVIHLVIHTKSSASSVL